MNINKFTQKSMEAVQNCEKLAYEYGNQQIDQPHLLYSLLTLDDSLIMKLITKMAFRATCLKRGKAGHRETDQGKRWRTAVYQQ